VLAPHLRELRSDLIERVLKDAYGSEWWGNAVPRSVRDTATKHKAGEAKEPWHGVRGKRDIDYAFLNDLWCIKDNWRHFKRFFPKQSWVEALITGDMNVSRRVFAHMNPLAENDVRNIEAAFRKWTNQLKGKECDCPSPALGGGSKPIVIHPGAIEAPDDGLVVVPGRIRVVFAVSVLADQSGE
jgi:hypothetical protein